MRPPEASRVGPNGSIMPPLRRLCTTAPLQALGPRHTAGTARRPCVARALVLPAGRSTGRPGRLQSCGGVSGGIVAAGGSSADACRAFQMKGSASNCREPPTTQAGGNRRGAREIAKPHLAGRAAGLEEHRVDRDDRGTLSRRDVRVQPRLTNGLLDAVGQRRHEVQRHGDPEQACASAAATMATDCTATMVKTIVERRRRVLESGPTMAAPAIAESPISLGMTPSTQIRSRPRRSRSSAAKSSSRRRRRGPGRARRTSAAGRPCLRRQGRYRRWRWSSSPRQGARWKAARMKPSSRIARSR